MAAKVPSLQWNEKYIPHLPHPKQAVFLSLPDREAFFGGAAGGGKSDALLMAALQYAHKPGYAALILRRTYADLVKPKALMDRAQEWLQGTDARPVDGGKSWRFPSGARLDFGYCATDADVYQYQSAEYQFVGFDELTQFSDWQYRYIGFSRVRRLEGVNVPLRTRGASNPGGMGHEWVRARFVDGERTFIASSVRDNPSLDADEYEESLVQLDPVTRAQLLNGDWTARAPGGFFQRDWFEIIEPNDVPTDVCCVRFWDCAATEKREGNDPGATVGCKAGKNGKAEVYVLDMRRDWRNPGGVDDLIASTANHDGRDVAVREEQEPGSSGKAVIAARARKLLGFNYKGIPSTGSKVARAMPVSSAAHAGLIKVVRGPWNGAFFDELEAFDPENTKLHDDQVDALSGAFAELTAPAEQIHRAVRLVRPSPIGIL